MRARKPERHSFVAALVAAMLVTASGVADATEARIDGPNAELNAELTASSMVIAAAGSTDPAPTPQDIVTAARSEYANLLGLLYDQGYYGPSVKVLVDGREAASISPFAVPAKIDQVVIQVDPGKRFTFGKAAIGPIAPNSELPDAFAPGETARASVVRDATSAARRGWRELGHAKVTVGDSKIVARHGTGELDVTVQIVPGAQLKFGALRVQGNENVREKRIREIAGLRYGRTFAPGELDMLVKRLRRTGAFSSVSIEEAEAPDAEGKLDIIVTVVEEPPRRLGFGAEISSTEGAKLSAYWMHRNVLGGAERLRFDVQASGIGGGTGSIRDGSGIDYLLGATFSRPGTFSPANTLGARVTLTQEDEPDYFSNVALGEVSLTRQLTERIEVTGALQLRYSDVEDELGERKLFHVLFPLTGQLDARDNVLNPKSGYFVRLEAQPFVGLDDVSDSGARIYGDTRGYYSFGERVTLAGRFQLGSVISDSLAGAPREFLFYSGGGGTVRGQPYRSLHDTLPNGASVGGSSFLGASAEARVNVTGKIAVVGFYDWGQISAENSFEGGMSHAGAGLGIRYDTPIGPIRLDVASPVSGTTGDGVQIYVGIGQAF